MSDENLADWFHQHLQTSAADLLWAVEQVPHARHVVSPPNIWGLGEWPVARHVFHLAYSEEQIALPSMRQWLGDQAPADVDAHDEAVAWGAGQDLDRMLARFRSVRAAQLALVTKFDGSVWEETRDAVWGRVSLRWVVSRTYQHTLEHTNAILRIALFWDFAARAVEAQAT